MNLDTMFHEYMTPIFSYGLGEKCVHFFVDHSTYSMSDIKSQRGDLDLDDPVSFIDTCSPMEAKVATARHDMCTPSYYPKPVHLDLKK